MIDYYTFTIIADARTRLCPRYRTLRTAKYAYLEKLRSGAQLNGYILGKSNVNDMEAITITPYNTEKRKFERTTRCRVG